MFDWLISIPGPQFLWIFPTGTAIILLVVLSLYRFDKSYGEPLPETLDLNVLEIGILSGGEKQAVQLALFELYKAGCFSFSSRLALKRTRSPNAISSSLLPLESVLKFKDQWSAISTCDGC